MTATQRVDVARLSELLDKATPGPWVVDACETYSIRDKDGGRFALLTHLLGRHGEGGRRDPDEVAATMHLIVAMHEALPALLQQLAEERELRMAVEKSWHHELARAAAAERAREECVADVERRFLSVRDMLPGDYITGYTEALAHIRAAFLAANGGRDEA